MRKSDTIVFVRLCGIVSVSPARGLAHILTCNILFASSYTPSFSFRVPALILQRNLLCFRTIRKCPHNIERPYDNSYLTGTHSVVTHGNHWTLATYLLEQSVRISKGESPHDLRPVKGPLTTLERSFGTCVVERSFGTCVARNAVGEPRCTSYSWKVTVGTKVAWPR